MPKIKVEMPSTPAVGIPGCFEAVSDRLARTVAPNDLAESFKPSGLELINYDFSSRFSV